MVIGLYEQGEKHEEDIDVGDVKENVVKNEYKLTMNWRSAC